MIVVDESTKIKSLDAERTKYVVNVLSPRASHRRILTGLPTPRSPLDLFSQFYYLDPTILKQWSFTAFRRRYAVLKRVQFPGARYPTDIVVDYQNTDELPRLIEPHSHRVDFRPEVPSTYSIRSVELTDEQKRIYKELKTYAAARLNEAGAHVTAPLVITQILRLHQVLCGHVVDENGIEREIPENKTEQLLEELDEHPGKAIVWCTYDADVRKVATAIAQEYDETLVYEDRYGLKKREPTFPSPVVARFWGGNLATREAEEREFKMNPCCRFMVATASAGGLGRTWDVADLAVYYSSSYDLEHREQSEQRPLNVGKKTGVDYVDLVAPGTIEMKILKALREKIDVASLVTGDAWREWVL
jgi:SNF2 family DNA or RNA helicase